MPSAREAILWLHGYTMDSRIWDEVWAALPGWRHIGVDLPRHGSAAAEPLSDRRRIGRQLAQEARRHGARHVVALSFGTMLALQAAIEDPTAFASVTLAAPALAGGPEDPAARVRYSQLAALYRRYGPGPHMTSLWLAAPPHIFSGLRAHADRFARVSAIIAGHRWSELGGDEMERLSREPQTRAELSRIAARVLVLRGDAELPAFVEAAAIVRDCVPGAREVVMPGIGHLSLLEAPERAAQAVAQLTS